MINRMWRKQNLANKQNVANKALKPSDMAKNIRFKIQKRYDGNKEEI